jgi:hypothetical protein
MEKLAVEIAASTDWDKLPHFNSVDDFLKFADTFIEQPENPQRRPRKRP